MGRARSQGTWDPPRPPTPPFHSLYIIRFFLSLFTEHRRRAHTWAVRTAPCSGHGCKEGPGGAGTKAHASLPFPLEQDPEEDDGGSGVFFGLRGLEGDVGHWRIRDL